jgi:hypothetical protein
MKKYLFLLPVLLALAACGAQPAPAQDVAERVDATLTATAQIELQPTPTLTPPAEVVVSPLSLEALQNGVYRSVDWGEFQLSEGVYYRTPPTTQESADAYTTRLLPDVYWGDLDSNGVEDAVVFLITQNGGTGHFVEMAAVLNVDGQAWNAAALSLGDRVVVEAGTVQDGVVTLNMRVHGPEDGLCCPSQSATWTFRLENGQWVRLP